MFVRTFFYFLMAVSLAFGFTQCSGQSKPVNVTELLAKKPGVIIDVRTNDEWNSGHRPEALHYDWNSGDLQRACLKLDKSQTYYLYCAAGVRAGKAADYMKSMGFKNVVNLGAYSNLR